MYVRGIWGLVAWAPWFMAACKAATHDASSASTTSPLGEWSSTEDCSRNVTAIHRDGRPRRPRHRGALLAWGLSKDAERSDLAAHGVPVTYHLTTCEAGYKGGLTCRGSFAFNGVIYRESLSGVLDSPPDGSKVAALVDPAHPGTSVWTVAAVRGPSATVSAETVGGVAALVVGIAIVAFGLRRKRSSQRPTA